MTEFTNELAKVIADESIACIKIGDFDDAKEIYFTMLDKIQDQQALLHLLDTRCH